MLKWVIYLQNYRNFITVTTENVRKTAGLTKIVKNFGCIKVLYTYVVFESTFLPSVKNPSYVHAFSYENHSIILKSFVISREAFQRAPHNVKGRCPISCYIRHFAKHWFCGDVGPPSNLNTFDRIYFRCSLSV